MRNNLVQGLLVGGAIVAVSLALLFAERAHLLGEDIALRITMAISGLVLAFYANAIPKAVFRSSRARAVQRFAGWVFVITGLGSAAMWLFAPMSLAFSAMFVIAAGLIAVVAYCLWSRTMGRPQAQ